jgi:hypothetical protein
MGCSASVHAAKSDIHEKDVNKDGEAKSAENVQGYSMKLIVNNKCPHIRIDSTDCVKSIAIEGERYNYDLKYCYVSQRGYYPHSLGKVSFCLFIKPFRFLENKKHISRKIHIFASDYFDPLRHC